MPEQNWLTEAQLRQQLLEIWQEETKQLIEQLKSHHWAAQSVLFEERAVRQEMAWRRAHQWEI